MNRIDSLLSSVTDESDNYVSNRKEKCIEIYIYKKGFLFRILFISQLYLVDKFKVLKGLTVFDLKSSKILNGETGLLTDTR